MLDLDYIKENTLWVVKFNCSRFIGTEKEIQKFVDNDNVRDIDTVSWEGQSKDLQPFYKAYNHAFYNLGRNDLFLIDDFYNEWIKDPNKFTEDHKSVISILSKELENLNDKDDLIVQNYDYQTVGNHAVGNYKEALQELSLDFNVVEVTEKYGYPTIIIQEDDQNQLDLLNYTVNHIAIRHDKYLGDGKYS